VGDGCDPYAVAEVAERVRSVEVVDRLPFLVAQAPVDGGLGEPWRELDHLQLEDFGGSHADRSIGGNEPLDFGDPGLTIEDGRDGDLRVAARDLAGVGEEVCDRRDIERSECCAIGIEELLNVGTFTRCQGTCASGRS
jgi:hypothetical protein